MNIWIKKPYQRETVSTLEQIENDVETGEIDPNITFCWYEGLEDWVLVSSILPAKIMNLADSTPPPIPVVKFEDNFSSSTIKNSYKDNSLYIRYSLFCVFIICFAIIVKSMNYMPSKSNNEDMRNLGTSILAVCVCRRFLWDICFYLKWLYQKSKFLYFVSIYLFPIIFVVSLFLIALFTRSSPIVVSVFMFGFLFSLDIPIGAYNKIKVGHFKKRRPYFVLWSIYGSFILIYTILLMAFPFFR